MTHLRRTFWKGTLGICAIFALAGAKGDGCQFGGDVDFPEPDPCQAGYHLETICEAYCAHGAPGAEEGSCGGESCKDECVSDDTGCPEGSELVEVCEPQPLPGVACLDGTDCDIPPPPPPHCYNTCKPAQPCGEGYHEEWICSGGGGDTPVVSPPPDGPTTDDGPIGPLPEGQSEPGTASGSSFAPEPTEDCHRTCVPNTCPPGTVEQQVCYSDAGGAEPTPDDNKGGAADIVGGGCYIECVSVAVCPPGQHGEELCYAQSDCDEPNCMDPVCELICVDDEDPEPGPWPTN